MITSNFSNSNQRIILPTSRYTNYSNMPRTGVRHTNCGFGSRNPWGRLASNRGRSTSSRSVRTQNRGMSGSTQSVAPSIASEVSEQTFHSAQGGAAITPASIDVQTSTPATFADKHPKLSAAAKIGGKGTLYTTIGAGGLSGIVLGAKADMREEEMKRDFYRDVEESMSGEKKSGYPEDVQWDTAKNALKRAKAREEKAKDVAAKAVAALVIIGVSAGLAWGWKKWGESSDRSRLEEVKKELVLLQQKIDDAPAGSGEQDSLTQNRDVLIRERRHLSAKLNIPTAV